MNIDNVVFFSNRVEVLVEQLSCCLFSATQPFTRRIVVVPNKAMKQWLVLQLAQEKTISMGVEVWLLSQAMEKMAAKQVFWPSPLDIALRVEQEIKRVLTSDEPLWLPLLSYLKIDDTSERFQKRLVALSAHMASLFLQYGRYGRQWIEEWESSESASWQQELWKTIFCCDWMYDYRFATQNDDFIIQGDVQIHFFALSFLPSVQHNFFMQLELPVYYYVLSPSMLFWGDIRSQGERAALRKNALKRGVKELLADEFDDYLGDGNPLLNNFGKLGREFFNSLEDTKEISSYVIHGDTKSSDRYRDYLLEEGLISDHSVPLNRLQTLQSDILLMVNPSTVEEVVFDKDDHSIQLHIAPNKFREVQILYDNILHVIGKQDPSDVIVMAPNIEDYVPYICAVFGGSESVLRYQLIDLKEDSCNSAINGLLLLFELYNSRWDVNIIVKLFQHPQFQRQYNLSEGDVETIKEWIKGSGIRWGRDSTHRDEIISRQYATKDINLNDDISTWHFGFNRLALGLVMAGEDSSFEGYLPYQHIDTTDSELISKFIMIMDSLHRDLLVFDDNQERTVSSWVECFKGFFDKYFLPDEQDYHDTQSREDLIDRLSTMISKDSSLQEASFSFISVYHHLKKLLSTETGSYNKNDLHAVKFCSMLPMRAIPAKIICIIGMDDEAFPRKDFNLSLNEMTGNSQTDYCPSRVDYDRYLFLEAILSARSHLLISYVGVDPMDQKEIAPSQVVSELFDYFDDIDHCIIKHHAQPFHEDYFSRANPLMQSYSQRYYKAAQSFYNDEIKKDFYFIPQKNLENLSTSFSAEENVVVDIRDLTAISRDPLRFYFNKVLGMYFKEGDYLYDEEPFTLSYRDMGLLGYKSLTRPVEDVLEREELEGNLPRGVLKQITTDKVLRSVSELYGNMDAMGVAATQVFSIKLSEHCKEVVKQSDGSLEVPAIKIDNVSIVGNIPLVTPRGFLAFAKDNFVDVIKVLPSYLVFSCLEVDIEPNILLAKRGVVRSIENQEQLLKHFLEYYFICLRQASPLLPEFIPLILQGDRDRLNKLIKEKTDEYFSLLSNSVWRLDAGEVMSSWGDIAQRIYAPIAQQWYPKVLREVVYNG